MHGKHYNFIQMAVSIGFLGNPRGIPYDVISACVCACMHVHVNMCGGQALTIPTPSTHPLGGLLESVKIQ